MLSNICALCYLQQAVDLHLVMVDKTDTGEPETRFEYNNTPWGDDEDAGGDIDGVKSFE